MSYTICQYHAAVARFALLMFLLTAGPRAFSQQNKEEDTDTIAAALQDSTGVIADSLDAGGDDTDSTKKQEYNYYDNREYWAADSFRLRQVPDSVIKKLQGQDDFWYANRDFKKKQENTDGRSMGFWNWLARQQWYKAVAWIIIIGGFLTVLVWFLASSNIGIFRRRSKTVADPGTGELAENIFEIDYAGEIEKAILGSNYRLAVRLQFLRLLKNLAERNIIHYKQGRTNFDYLSQLSNSGYYKDFFRLVRNYEYTWYGEFSISPGQFTIIKNDFENFDKKLH